MTSRFSENADARYIAGTICDQVAFSEIEKRLRLLDNSNFTPTTVSAFIDEQISDTGHNISSPTKDLSHQIDQSIGSNMNPYDYEQSVKQAGVLLSEYQVAERTVGLSSSLRGHAWRRRQQHELVFLRNVYWKEDLPEDVTNLNGAARESAELAYLRNLFQEDIGHALSTDDIDFIPHLEFENSQKMLPMVASTADNTDSVLLTLSDEDVHEGFVHRATDWIHVHKDHVASGCLIVGGFLLGGYAAYQLMSSQRSGFDLKEARIVPGVTLDIDNSDFRNQTAFATPSPFLTERLELPLIMNQAIHKNDEHGDVRETSSSNVTSSSDASEIILGQRVFRIDDTSIPSFPTSDSIGVPGVYALGELRTILGEQEELYGYFECGPAEVAEEFYEIICAPIDPTEAEMRGLNPLILASIFQNSGYDYENPQFEILEPRFNPRNSRLE